MKQATFNCIYAGLIGAALALGAYNNYQLKAVEQNVQKLGTVNISKAVELQEKHLLSKKLSSSEITRETELFALKLRRVLGEIKEACGCELIVKNAVVSPSAIPDYTPDLISALGLAESKKAAFTSISFEFDK